MNKDTGLRGEKLFDAVIEQIQMDPASWDQSSWSEAELKSEQDTLAVTDIRNQTRVLKANSYSPPQWNINNGPVFGIEVSDLAEFAHDLLPATCGTTRCVAGWAAELAGAKIEWRAVHLDTATGRRVVAGLSASACITPDGRYMPIPEYAREVLELSADEANVMFSGSKTLIGILNTGDKAYSRGDYAPDTEDFSDIDESTFPEYPDPATTDLNIFFFDGRWDETDEDD